MSVALAATYPETSRARGGQVFAPDVNAWFVKRDQATLSIASAMGAKVS